MLYFFKTFFEFPFKKHVKNQTCDSPMSELQKWNQNLRMSPYPIPVFGVDNANNFDDEKRRVLGAGISQRLIDAEGLALLDSLPVHENAIMLNTGNQQ